MLSSLPHVLPCCGACAAHACAHVLPPCCSRRWVQGTLRNGFLSLLLAMLPVAGAQTVPAAHVLPCLQVQLQVLVVCTPHADGEHMLTGGGHTTAGRNARRCQLCLLCSQLHEGEACGARQRCESACPEDVSLPVAWVSCRHSCC